MAVHGVGAELLQQAALTASIAAQQVKLLINGGALVHMTHEDRQVTTKLLLEAGFELADAGDQLAGVEVSDDVPPLRLVTG